MTSEEERQRGIQQQAHDQYAMLGRYVTAFEQMIEAMRRPCRFYLSSRGAGQDIANILLNHKGMAAQNVLDVFRSMTYTHVMGRTDFDKKEKTFNETVLTYACSEVRDLIEIRNQVLHATWYIGWAGESDTETVMHGMKYVIHGKGTRLASLPTVEKMKAIIHRTEHARGCIEVIGLCILTNFEGSLRTSRNFRKENDTWVLLPTVSPSIVWEP